VPFSTVETLSKGLTLRALTGQHVSPKVRRVRDRFIHYTFPQTIIRSRKGASWTAPIVTDFLRYSRTPKALKDSLSSVTNS